jgi:L-asparagine transporter-like permease
MAAESPLPYDKDGGEYHRGDMTIDEQKSTYDMFMGLSKWGSLAVIAVVLWSTVAFAVGAGWLTALMVTVVVVAIGIFLLREKKQKAEQVHPRR